jgi:hypothetical protein
MESAMLKMQDVANIGGIAILLCLVGAAAAAAAEPRAADVPFAATGDFGNAPSQSAPPVFDDASLDANGIRRLPPADAEVAAGDGIDFDRIERQPPAEQPRDELGGFGFRPGIGPEDRGPVGYKAFWFPTEPVEGQAANWSMVGQDLLLRYPLWVDLPNVLLLTGGVRNRLISTDAILPDSHQAYPSELWDARLGLMYLRKLDGDRMLGGGVNVGSASDHPFASIREMNVSMTALYRVPSGERNAWMFMLMYSPVGELKIPIPGISYNYNPSDQFHASIGLPFSITYRPTDRWSFDASYMLIHTIHVRVSYKIAESLKAFYGYDWSNEVYMLRDRLEDNDRFFLYDQRVTLGLEMPVSRYLSAEVVGGYAFDRFSFTGQNWDSAGTDRVDVAPGPFAAITVSLRR